MALPSNFYKYCVSMGVPETGEAGNRGINISELPVSKVGMLQAYELSRIADALELEAYHAKSVTLSLKRVADAIKETNAIFEAIHSKLKKEIDR